MQLMFNLKKTTFIIFISIFIGNGLLYYLFPANHYTETGGGGWISYIKYVCILATIPFLFSMRLKRDSAYNQLLFVVIIAFTMLPAIYWINNTNFLLIQYQIAVVAMVFSRTVLKYFSDESLTKFLVFLLITTSALCLSYELIFKGHVDYYSRSGLRGAGPFINPNNTGIFICLMAAVFNHFEKNIFANLLLSLLVIFIVTVTGSKTALLLLIVLIVFGKMFLWKYLLALTLIFPLLFFHNEVFSYWQGLGMRDFSNESAIARIDDIQTTLSNVFSGPIQNILFGISNVSVVDNAYLDMLSFGGIFVLLPFIIVQFSSIYFCFKNSHRLLLLLHFMLLISMFTTNIPRLWPVAYLYWLIVGISFMNPLHFSKSLLSSPYVCLQRRSNKFSLAQSNN